MKTTTSSLLTLPARLLPALALLLYACAAGGSAARTAALRPAAAAAITPPAPVPVLFRGVRVFDGERMIPRTDVLVTDGRIARIAASIPAPAGATVVDGTGRTLLPGLIDAHTHVFGNALEEALIFGVTTELDMFSDVRSAAVLQRAQRAGDVHDRADIFSAGTLVTAPGGHGTQFGIAIPTITHADSADAFVAARIAEGSEWIKIVYEDGGAYRQTIRSIDRATLQALVRAAHAQQRRAVVHVSTLEAARHALEAGADGLVHVFVDAPVDNALIQLARRSGAFVVPTLVVIRGMTGTGGAAALVEDARLAPYLGPQSRQLLTSSFPPQPATYTNALATTRQLHTAGIPILAGSDAPNPGTAHGSALHRELELLVEAGLTPLEALQAATSTPARAFGLTDRGRIAAGLRADLVLVEGDPTADITATRAIVGVWKAGAAVDRASYAGQVKAALEQAAVAAADADRARARGLIADFEDGRPVAAFGTEWFPSTDAMIGGTSTVSYAVVDGGADGTARSLRLSGRIDGALPNAWAGVMWSPGVQPMEPQDLSDRTGLRFATRGDGREYAVLLFSRGRGMSPIMRMFAPGRDWTEVSMPWSDFGVDGSDIMAILFVATPPAGEFDFQVDNVRLY